MSTPRVSVIIPARNERFLAPTVRDLLAHAAGDVEVLVVCDGYWPNPPLPDDQRLRILHFGEARGMRACINAAAGVARGKYLLKSDAHCLWPEGYDDVLVEDYHEDNWILIPRRYALDPEAWAIDPSNKKYPVDAHFLSEPLGKYGDSVPGIHASPWTARREARKDVLLDREIGSQGSAWFVSAKCWDWLGPMDASLFGSFWLENFEMSMKAWLRGGAQMISKRTSYSHLYKGKRYGRGYSTAGMGHEDAVAYASWFYMTDQPFAGKVRTFRSLIEEFAPMPTWADIDAIFIEAGKRFSNPYMRAA